MEYGKLIISIDLSKTEARQIEELLSRGTTVIMETLLRAARRSAEHSLVECHDILVGEKGHNIQYLTVKGRV